MQHLITFHDQKGGDRVVRVKTEFPQTLVWVRDWKTTMWIWYKLIANKICFTVGPVFLMSRANRDLFGRVQSSFRYGFDDSLNLVVVGLLNAN